MATATAASREEATTKTDQPFQRGRHLALALVGLAHAPISALTGAALVWATSTRHWSAELATANAMLWLCLAAFAGWLAFAVFDTNAGVTIWPRRWRDIGGPLAAWCVAQEVYILVTVWLHPELNVPKSLAAFVEFGELRIGWLAAMLLAAAAAEEIIYRALLLRALEGYASPRWALVIQAAVFELVHAYVYGYGITGIWFIGGLVLGYAFQRTRSLAVPTLLHAAHNFLLFTAAWYFNQ